MKKRAVFGSIACLFAVMVWLLSGCATVFKGTSNNVNFSSDPSAAKVYVNGFLMGTTPVKLKLESKKVYQIEFKKEGFETKTFTITNHVGVGWVILDIVLGLVPVIVDAATGAWYELDQDNINAILEKQQ
ncbi:MAG: PEGA domain-containing protein [Candidatus Aminicenantes bacterium]|nr:PEGA domain-containing protein [Candidatus Aminicenantes bacterium]